MIKSFNQINEFINALFEQNKQTKREQAKQKRLASKQAKQEQENAKFMSYVKNIFKPKKQEEIDIDDFAYGMSEEELREVMKRDKLHMIEQALQICFLHFWQFIKQLLQH